MIPIQNHLDLVCFGQFLAKEVPNPTRAIGNEQQGMVTPYPQNQQKDEQPL
jgi:hypothetical protein